MSATLSPAQEQALLALLMQRRQMPFAWGARDCCLFAADAVHVLVGRDPAIGLRGTYGTAGQAMRLLKSLGGLAGVLESRFGVLLDRAEAADGSVALIDSRRVAGTLAGQGALGVVWKGRVVAQGGPGLVGLPLAEARSFWRPLEVMP